MTKLRYFFVIIFCLTISSCHEEEYLKNNISNDSYFEFLSLVTNYEEKSLGGIDNNDNGRFAWDQTYILLSLSKLTSTYSDEFFQKYGLKIIHNILNGTDKKRSVDLPNNQSTYTWSSLKYSDGERVIWNAHTAFIIYSSLEFLSNCSLDECDSLKKHFLKAFETIEDDWVDTGEKEGYYEEPFLTSKLQETPLNLLALMGLASLKCYTLNKDPILYERARNTRNYILQNSTIMENGSLVWPYKPPLVFVSNNQINNPDDISHAGIVSLFFLEFEEISNSDLFLRNFKSTILKNVVIGDNKYHRFIQPYSKDDLDKNTVNFLPYIFFYLKIQDIDSILSSQYYSYNFGSTEDFNHFGSRKFLPFAFLKSN